MQTTARPDANAILVKNQSLQAAKCDLCGAKIYPATLLKTHLSRHRRRRRWFTTELKKLQQSIAHMRAFS